MLQSGIIANGDWHVHYFRLAGFVEALQEGAWRPLWHADANAGYGAPTFLFYQPASYYVAAIPMAAGLTMEWTWKLVYLVILLGTAEGARRLFHHWAPALTSAILAAVFVLSPSVLFPVHQINMPAHALGFMWMPWLVHFALLSSTSRVRGATGVAVVLALQIVSHPLIAMQGMVVVASLALVDACLLRRRQTLVALGAAVAVAMLVSAWYWLPVAAMRHLVHWEYLLNPAWSWNENVLFARPQALTGAFHANRLYFDVAAVAALLTAVMAVVTWSPRSIRSPAVGIALSAAFVFVLMTPAGTLLVDIIPPLGYLQFAWRWLGLLTLLALAMVAIGSGRERSDFGNALRGRMPPWVSALPLLALVPISLAVTGIGPSQAWTGMTAQRTDPLELETASRKERWATLEMRPRSMGRSWNRDPSRDPLPLFMPSSVAMSPIVHRRTQHALWFDYRADAGTTLRVRHLHFPGWTASADGSAIPVGIETNSGAMLIELPAGGRRVHVRFEAPTVVRIGTVLSAISLLLALLALGLIRSERIGPASPQPR